MKALWIRVEAHEVDSVRVAQLAEFLGIDPVHALGHLVALGGQVAEQTPDGHIANVPNMTIERWARWTGKRDLFARAVREILQDGEGYLDDWRESMGKLIERRDKERTRKRRGVSTETARSFHGNSEEIPRNDHGVSGATVRDVTERTTTTRPAARADVANSTNGAVELTFGALMLLVAEHLYVPDGTPPNDWDQGRDGSILKELRKVHSAGDVAAAIEGLAIVRDYPGKYADSVDWLKKGEKVTLRALYHSNSGVLPMFNIATTAYWKAGNGRPQ